MTSARRASTSASARRRRPVLSTLMGAVALLGVGSLLVPTTLSSAGCATQQQTPTPDAAPPPCDPGPFIFCQPVADDQAGCNTDDGTSTWLTRLPRSTRYPVGCVVNVLVERDPDTQDCDLKAVCKCGVTTIGVGLPGADAGDEGGAPLPEPTETPPAWNCSP